MRSHALHAGRCSEALNKQSKGIGEKIRLTKRCVDVFANEGTLEVDQPGSDDELEGGRTIVGQ